MIIITDDSKALPYEVHEPEGQPLAAFKDEAEAEGYISRTEAQRKISCCRRSRYSNGWHHNDNCPNSVITY